MKNDKLTEAIEGERRRNTAETISRQQQLLKREQLVKKIAREGDRIVNMYNKISWANAYVVKGVAYIEVFRVQVYTVGLTNHPLTFEVSSGGDALFNGMSIAKYCEKHDLSNVLLRKILRRMKRIYWPRQKSREFFAISAKRD